MPRSMLSPASAQELHCVLSPTRRLTQKPSRVADTENLNRALRTPGLLPGVPAARHTYVVTDRAPAESVSRHTFVVTEEAPTEEVTGTPEYAQVMAAFTRSILPCPGCGLPGVQGTPWNPCCKRFSTPQVICSYCHTFTSAAAFERTGCSQSVKLPPCGTMTILA